MSEAVLIERAEVSPVGHDAPVTPAAMFEHVSFAFDDHVVLRDISFSVPSGAMRMLLGASGSARFRIRPYVDSSHER